MLKQLHCDSSTNLDLKCARKKTTEPIVDLRRVHGASNKHHWKRKTTLCYLVFRRSLTLAVSLHLHAGHPHLPHLVHAIHRPDEERVDTSYSKKKKKSQKCKDWAVRVPWVGHLMLINSTEFMNISEIWEVQRCGNTDSARMWICSHGQSLLRGPLWAKKTWFTFQFLFIVYIHNLERTSEHRGTY